jgi:hypothetical protein
MKYLLIPVIVTGLVYYARAWLDYIIEEQKE